MSPTRSQIFEGGHEEHEVRNEISTNLLTFVAFVSFVVKISVFFGCGSPALGSSW